MVEIGNRNWMELNLSPEEDAFVRTAAEMYKATHLDPIDSVFKIAEAVAILQRRHYASGIQGAFADALVQYGFTNRNDGPMDKHVRYALSELRKSEGEVRAWWRTVDARRRRTWKSAVAIHRHWKRSQEPPDPTRQRRQTPLEAERATNVTLQEALNSANAEIARLRGADGDATRFDLELSSTEHIGRAIVDAWRERPSRIEALVKTLSAEVKEIRRLMRAARPRRER